MNAKSRALNLVYLRWTRQYLSCVSKSLASCKALHDTSVELFLDVTVYQSRSPLEYLLHTFAHLITRIMGKKRTPESYHEQISRLHPTIKILGKYESAGSRVAVHCNTCGHDWSPFVGSLASGHGCPVCSGSAKTDEKGFIWKLQNKRKDVVLIGNYKGAGETTEFKFLDCGHVTMITPSKVLSGRGCPICGLSKKGASQRYDLDRFKEIMSPIDTNLEVIEGEEYKNSATPIKVRCQVCGYDFKISLNHLRKSCGCPNCHRRNTSFFEQYIFHSFVMAYGLENVLSRDKSLIGEELDIVVPALNFAIEPGSWYYHRKCLKHDSEKKEKCAQKGIRLVTVYDHYTDELPPFDDCVITKNDLSAGTYRKELMAVVNSLFEMAGKSASFSQSDWDEIEKRARRDSRRMTTQEFRDELAKTRPTIEFVDEYDLAGSPKRFRCKICGYEWVTTPTTIRCGSGCARCSKVEKLTDEKYRNRLARYYPNIVLLDQFKGLKTRHQFECTKCGYTWTNYPYRHIHIKDSVRVGCPNCNSRKRKPFHEFVKEVERQYPDIEVIGKFDPKNQRIEVRCRKCGYTWNPIKYNIKQGCACQKCKKIKETENKTILS